MKRVIVIAAVGLLPPVVLLHSAIKDFLWTHPWWHSFIVALPAIALAILAYFELLHSSEANRLCVVANGLSSQVASLNAERNTHLHQIAANTERPVTQAERNARILRKHLKAQVVVSEGQGGWGHTPEIAEVSDDNIVTLFKPHSPGSPGASCCKVHCEQLEIVEIPQGSCPLRLKILKRYGPDVQLGEITRWEDRLQPEATPTFRRGDTAYSSRYVRPGSPGERNLYIYAAKDDANSFALVTATGETFVGNNIEVSKRFMALQIDYQAAGFRRISASGNPLQLFVC